MTLNVSVEARVVEGERRHPVCQMSLVNAIISHLSTEQSVGRLLQRDMQAVIDGANLIVEELAKPERSAPAACGLDDWLASDQTGLSSLRMARLLSDGPLPSSLYCAKPAWPHDPADFGRCLGLLEACPELRERVPRMAADGPQWAVLVEHWDELTARYHAEFPTGSAPRLLARMDELFREAQERSRLSTITRLQELRSRHREAASREQRTEIEREMCRLTESWDDHTELIPDWDCACLCHECRTCT